MSAKPWFEARPGAPVTAKAWNGWQIEFQRELAAHDHTGDDKGAPLTGESFDPQSELKVKALHLTETAVVGGMDILEKAKKAAADATKQLGAEVQKMLPKTGGKLTGKHMIDGSLGGRTLKVGGKLIVGGKEIEPVLPATGHYLGVSGSAVQGPYEATLTDSVDSTTDLSVWGNALRFPLRLTRRSLVFYLHLDAGLYNPGMGANNPEHVAIVGQGRRLWMSSHQGGSVSGAGVPVIDWEARSQFAKSSNARPWFAITLPAGDWVVLIGEGTGYSWIDICLMVFPCMEASDG